jgi:hypothetical protein
MPDGWVYLFCDVSAPSQHRHAQHGNPPILTHGTIIFGISPEFRLAYKLNRPLTEEERRALASDTD